MTLDRDVGTLFRGLIEFDILILVELFHEFPHLFEHVILAWDAGEFHDHDGQDSRVAGGISVLIIPAFVLIDTDRETEHSHVSDVVDVLIIQVFPSVLLHVMEELHREFGLDLSEVGPC